MPIQADSANQDVMDALEGYGNISLPDLSHARNPTPGFISIETNVHPGCTEGHLVAALARCLGTYCAVNDILMGWPTSHGAQRAVRVRWLDTTTWNQIIQGLSPFPVSEDDLRLSIGIQSRQSPFVALVSSDSTEANTDHPLVASLSGSRVSMKFSTEVFHESTASILLSQVREALARTVEEPDQSVSLSFLSGDLLSRVDLTPEVAPYTHIPNVDFVTEFLPLRDPESIVLEYHPDLSTTGGVPQSLTFRELRSLSNQFARYLLKLGLNLEDKVAVSLPKCLNLYVAMMGIWKAGGCYVPVDPDLPLERREFIVKDSNAQFVVNTDNVRLHLENAAQYSKDDINVAHPDALSYMLYTSGTTGTPKGCLLTQRGLTQAIMGLSFDAKFDDCENPRFLAVAAIAFDVHISEFLLPCALGMTHVVVPRTQVLEDLALWIRELRITHFGTVPSLIEATLIHIDDADFFLRYISCGGEKMTDVILERWGGHPVTKLVNYYGPSEVTIGCSSMRMSPNTRKESIGRIFANSTAYVVDENLELVIRGAAGELLVGGPLVGRGYHRRDDLTKKSFVTWEGQKLYRTGDLVRLMPDDTMEMLGRIDTQIKLRGVRIEVEGISSIVRNAAMKTPGLSSKTKVDVYTILGRHPSIQSDQLVSFVTWTTGASISERRSRQPKVLLESPKGMAMAIKDACKTGLASYMRPAHIIFVEFLPLNSNGKTDARALGSIFTSQDLQMLSAQYATANEVPNQQDNNLSRSLTKLEEEVIDVVSHLSSVPQSSINLGSNLFELGFDSLKFIRLTAELRSKFSLTAQQWSVTEAMSSESILQISSTISSRLNADLKPEHISSSDTFISNFEARMRQRLINAYDLDSIDGVYPTFPLQDGVLYRSSSDDALYIQHVIMKIGSGTSESSLKGAWETVQLRHEILRTVFYFSDAIAQIVLKADHSVLPWHSETETNADNSKPFSTRFYEDQSRAVESDINTNISTKPPFRILLVKDETATHLVLSIHHAIFDARSLDLLFADVERAYHEQALEDHASLSESLSCIYATDASKAKQFWRNMFNGFRWPRMAPAASKSERSSSLDITLNTRYEDLLARAHKARVTLSNLCAVAFAVCLARHVYEASDLAFGTIASGRSFADKKYDDAQCPLLTVIPTRVNLNKGVAVLQDLQRETIEALRYSHIPLGHIQQWVRPGQQLFEILFSMAIEETHVPSLWDVVSSTQPAADFPLAVEVMRNEKANEMHINAAFTGTFKESIVWRILQEFEGVLMSLSADASTNPLDSFTPVRPNGSAIELISQVEEGEGVDSDMLDDARDENLESKLRDVVSRFLDISPDKLDANASLVSLGLDSIKSIGLSRSLKADGLKITAVELMQHSSLRRLARFLQSGSAESVVANKVYTTDATELLESRRREIAAIVNVHDLQLGDDDLVDLFPTTDLQSGMLSQTINSAENLYIHEFIFKIDPSVDIERLRDAWSATIKECDILRTSFHFLVDPGVWIQAVHSMVNSNWHDLNKPTDKSLAEEVQEFIRANNLSEEVALSRPPVHFLVRYEGASRCPSHLVLVLHHALYDGISIPILKRRVEAHYGRERHDDSQTPTSTVQFHDLLGQMIYQEVHGVEYWTKYVDGYHPLALPRTPAREVISTDIAYTTKRRISVSPSSLRDAISIYGVTTQCLGQAIMAERLANIYESGDVVFGHVLSGRNLHGSEDVVGPMITSVPCRVRLNASMKVNLATIRSIHWHNVEAGSWQHISLRKIQQGLGLRSLWDSLFVFQSQESLASPGAQAMVFDDSVEETLKLQYALNVEMYQTEGGFVLKAACQSNAMTSDGLRAFVDDFAGRLLEIIDTPLTESVNSSLQSGIFSAPNQDEKDNIAFKELATSSAIAQDEYPQHVKFLDILSQTTKIPISLIKSDTSLASMGIDSISSIQVVAKSRASGFVIRAAQILKCDRVSELLESVSMTRSNGVAAQDKPHTHINGVQHRKKPSKDVNGIESILPASPGITWLVGMWQISRRRQFQYCFAYRLAKGTSTKRLEEAWIHLTKLHPILRSTFAVTDGSHVQVVTFHDLPGGRLWSTSRLEGNREEVDIVRGLTEEMVSNPLSTEQPPIRAILMQGNDSAYLVLHLHHFQYDAWSLDVLLNDLTTLYNGGKISPPGEGDMCNFLRYCQPSDTQKSEQREFWRTHLQIPFKPSLLTKRLVAPKIDKREVLICHRTLKNAEVLRDTARQLSISFSALLVSCWSHALANACNTRDVTFGLWQSGRSSDLEGIENMGVPCMNVLPIQVEFADTLSESLCRSINSHLRQRTGIVEQTLLEDIRNWTELERGPMFNVCLNILDFRIGSHADEKEGKLLEPLNIPYYIPDRPDRDDSRMKTLSICDLVKDSLMAEIIVRGDDIDISIEYDPNYLDESGARSLIDNCSKALRKFQRVPS
ncbi:AMP-binding-domain-containing protein [Schizopora paradoxa]|uniref:AMP-binding-domain-containing protein n=1 Tax=Schizopora paradoxa TaxID=27342 RepID=A0A0H2RQN6_9AGAM|nr:AMP-binding-domain-containing protein [Schizopora paradoxa]